MIVGPSAITRTKRDGPIIPYTLMLRCPQAYPMLIGSGVSNAGTPISVIT